MPQNKVRHNEPMTNDEFLAAKGAQCPYCRSRDIEGNSFEFTGEGLSQFIWCMDCSQTWFDLYQLVGYEKNE